MRSASIYQHGQAMRETKTLQSNLIPKPRNLNVVCPPICRSHNNLKYLMSSKVKDLRVTSIQNYLFPSIEFATGIITTVNCNGAYPVAIHSS